MQNRWLRVALCLSLLIHGLLTLFVYVAPYFMTANKPQVVQLEIFDPNEKPLQKPLETTQIVDQDSKPINNEVPVNAKFLSANNQTVKKQTVAKNRGDFRNTQSKAQKNGNGGQPVKKLTMDDFKPKLDFSKAVENKSQQEIEFDKRSEELALQAAEKKKQQPQQARAATPGDGGEKASQTVDYIKDIDPGLETLLQTREFVYYTYYARIRRQLNQHWGTMVKDKVSNIYKQGRTIASTDDKITKLLITLDKKGNLVKAQVIGDSGVVDLDEAAVEAFKAAAPFPNPPPGIIESDGTIKIRWDFILEA